MFENLLLLKAGLNTVVDVAKARVLTNCVFFPVPFSSLSALEPPRGLGISH